MNLSAKFKYLLLICLMSILYSTVHAQNKECFKVGADREEIYLPKIKDKTIAVVTNQTGLLTDKNHTHLVDFLLQKGIKIKTIFAPEHGFRGNADAGEHVKNGTDTKTGLPIISLYGDNQKPKPNQLQDIDCIIFDIQDVGVRFYTYISTLTLVMEAAAENNKEVIVLDRPNPHDGYIDGPLLDPKFSSFVGMHPVPVIYGLTIGEYGNMINGEKWLKNGIQCKYTMVPMMGYHKQQRYGMLDRPSPNLPNDKAINLYPSLCLFEGTNISVGRGTDFPFQTYGSPYTQNMKFSFTPKPNFGAKNPIFNGEKCYGEDLRNYPKDLRELNLDWVLTAFKNDKDAKNEFFLKNLFFDKLAGTDALRKQILSGKTAQEIKNSWKKGLESFDKTRKKYIVYAD